MDGKVALTDDFIKSKIFTIRGLQVMLDSDLAELYEVPVKALNQAIKRNQERFPKDFMFQLNKKEFDVLRSQIVTANVMFSKKRFSPYVFTEQGVATLSGVLKSDKAIIVNIQIMRTFVKMRKFISDNADIFARIDNVERNQLALEIKTDSNFEKVFKAIEKKDIKPDQGIFFNGQIFDAYKFVSDLIRSAKESVILIDNYIDDSVLTLFTKRKKNVGVIIYTKKISKQLALDLEKHNAQYPEIKIKKFIDSHDRFMIIDNKEVYHIGASLKDLGKKWFAFSKFDKGMLNILNKLP